MLEDIYSFFYYFFKYYFKKFFSYIRWIFLFVYKTYSGEQIVISTLKILSFICGLIIINNFLFNCQYYNWYVFNYTDYYYFNFFNYRCSLYLIFFLLLYLFKFISKISFVSNYLHNNPIKNFIKSNGDDTINLSLKDKSKFYKNMFLFLSFIKFFLTQVKLLLNYLSILFKKVILHYFGFVIKSNITLFKSCLFYVTKTFFIFWRPLFKKLSYFGLFRSYRTKWFWKN